MWERLTRRSFVREISTATFGVVVLGTAACASGDQDTEPSSGPIGTGGAAVW